MEDEVRVCRWSALVLAQDGSSVNDKHFRRARMSNNVFEAIAEG
jgi:hypothetical protein